MDSQVNHIERQQITKRPRWLTLCMMATAASVIVLAGCGDNEETAPPVEETSPLEQDATTQPETTMNQEPTMQEDPGLPEDSADSMNQGSTVQEMPDDTMDEPVEGSMNPNDEEAGFGEGTDPMPGTGADDEDSTPSTQ